MRFYGCYYLIDINYFSNFDVVILNVNILKFMRKILALCVLVSALISCKNEKIAALKVDVSNIQSDVNIDRFDVDFYTTSEENLGKIKKVVAGFVEKLLVY